MQTEEGGGKAVERYGFHSCSVWPEVINPKSINCIKPENTNGIQKQIIQFLVWLYGTENLKRSGKHDCVIQHRILTNKQYKNSTISSPINGNNPINDLRNRLTEKESEMINLKEENQRLSNIIEQQNKDIKLKTSQLEEFAVTIEQYKMIIDPASEQYGSKVQEILNTQQLNHERALTDTKSQVRFYTY